MSVETQTRTSKEKKSGREKKVGRTSEKALGKGKEKGDGKIYKWTRRHGPPVLYLQTEFWKVREKQAEKLDQRVENARSRKGVTVLISQGEEKEYSGGVGGGIHYTQKKVVAGKKGDLKQRPLLRTGVTRLL